MASNASQVAVTSQGSYYTKEQKNEFIANYLVLGNVSMTAEMMNIPDSTGRGWVNSDWGVSLLDELRDIKSDELDATYSNIIHATQSQVIDRITDGDYILDKQNDLIRKPINGKDLAMIGAITFDKRQISRNLPTSINTSMDNAALTKLQQQFQALSKQSKVVEGDTFDNEPD